jgi:hypothetical protein
VGLLTAWATSALAAWLGFEGQSDVGITLDVVSPTVMPDDDVILRDSFDINLTRVRSIPTPDSPPVSVPCAYDCLLRHFLSRYLYL